MMKTKLAVALLFMLSLNYTSFAQEASIEWSESIKYVGTSTPFLQNIVGDTDDLIFVSGVYQPESLGHIPQSSQNRFQYTLISFDKKTLRIVNQVEVRPYKDKEYEDLWHIETVVINDQIFIFWQKDDNKSLEVFYESFDLSLNRILSLTSIMKEYHLGPKNPKLEAFVLTDKTVSSKLVVGINFPVQYFFTAHFKYRTIHKDHSISDKQSLILGRSVLMNSYFLTEEKELGPVESRDKLGYIKYGFIDDSTLIYKLGFSLDLNVNKAVKYNLSSKRYPDNTSGYIPTWKGVPIASINKDTEEEQSNGILYKLTLLTTDSEQKKSYNLVIPLPRQLALEMDSISPNEKSFITGNPITKPSDRFWGFDNSLILNKVVQEPDGTLLLFTDNEPLTIEERHSTTDLGPKTNTLPPRTKTYITSYKTYRKRNVFILSVDSNFNYKWHTTIQRTKSYIKRDVQDINVKVLEDGYLVVFGDDVNESTKPKSKNKLKSNQEQREEIEYAFITRDGKMDQKKFNINANRTSDQDEKEIHPAQAFYTLDNELYILGNREIGRLIVR